MPGEDLARADRWAKLSVAFASSTARTFPTSYVKPPSLQSTTLNRGAVQITVTPKFLSNYSLINATDKIARNKRIRTPNSFLFHFIFVKFQIQCQRN